jgi:hypothetical protein
MFAIRWIACLLLVSTSAVRAQWNPTAGQWGKTEPEHIRVMTWNVYDRLCSTNTKAENGGTWHGMAVIVASLKPDILILQETGDNSGNGTGSNADSFSTMQTVVRLFIEGGSDPFRGGSVGAYVQKYAPGYDLPYRFISSEGDGFNRNLILSRYPFVDLNGDGRATISDIPNVNGDGFSAGGDGGTRGFAFAEIALPNDIYRGDLVIGNAHLKAFSDPASQLQRETAARNVGYYIYHMFAGGGTNTPDPNNAISDSPAATMILDQFTPVIFGGDWNEDELTNGRRGPAEYLTQGGVTGGTDGTDRDSTDATYDTATDVFTANRTTLGNSKLDYIGWWDSAATAVRQFIFNSSTIPASGRPPEFASHPSPQSISGLSDHRPVIVDFQVALAEPTTPTPFNLLLPLQGQTSAPVQPQFIWSNSANVEDYTLTIALDPLLNSVVQSYTDLPTTAFISPTPLAGGTQYYWGVRANNAEGFQDSTPFARTFTTVGVAGPGTFNLLTPANDATGVAFDGVLDWSNSTGASTYRVTLARNPSLTDIIRTVDGLTASDLSLASQPLDPCEEVYWRVEAINTGGTTVSQPASRRFVVENPLDIADDFGTLGAADGTVSFGDFLGLLGLIGPCPGGIPSCTGDFADDFGTLVPDGQVSFGDFLALLGYIGFSCGG